jgi:actin-related protein 6
MLNNPVIVLDNGAATIKVGIANGSVRQNTSQGLRIIPNAVVRSKGDKTTYFGHELGGCRDYSSLHYRLPFEKVCRTIATCDTYLRRDRDI